MSKVTEKEEPLNLNLAEPIKAKSLYFLLVCDVDGCSTNIRAFIVSEKANEIVKASKGSLKNTCEYACYWQWK